MDSASKAYSKFLERAELSNWLECMGSYSHARDDGKSGSEPSLTAISESLCISTYVQWMSSLCGESDYLRDARKVFARGVRLVREIARKRKPDDPMLLKAEGIIAASSGYGAAARKIFQDNELELSLTIELMLLSASFEERARDLKRYIGDKKQENYLPAIYFYAHALLDLGYEEQVEMLIDSVPEFAHNSLLLDIRGKLFELRGAWQEAYDVYRRSDWVEHKYRRIICEIIVRGAKRFRQNSKMLEKDTKLKQGMSRYSGEVDLAAVTRSQAFINACRWQDFDNWLVHFELGKLSFQRKRHAEADRHLRLAFEQAPASFQFLIQNLRFVNLTWLNGVELPARPEILECAFAALGAAEEEEESRSHIRNYLVQSTGEKSIGSAVLDTEDAFEKGEVHRSLQNTPEALRWWSQAIEESFVPRAYFRLIQHFADFRFEHTVCYLVDLVKHEAWDNFFDLWELGREVLKLQREGMNISLARKLEQPFSQIIARVEELCQFEFQHLMRAFRFFIECDRYDIAQTLLTRASKLAESPEEHLNVAIAQRQAPWISAADEDVLGVKNLLTAEKTSRDRLERLQIAREFVHYGQIQRGRNILSAEGILEPDRAFEPIEYIVALQCGQPCLSSEEYMALVKLAETSLESMIKSKKIVNYGKAFIERLTTHAKEGSLSHLQSLVTSPSAKEKENGKEEEYLWVTWEHGLARVKDTDLEEERILLEQRIEQVEGDATLPFYGYTLWGHVIKRFEFLSDVVMWTRPEVEAGQIPISKNPSLALKERSRRLSGLWREYLQREDEESQSDIKALITEFYQEEQLLIDKWNELRRQKMEMPMRRLEYYAAFARRLLDIIRSQADQENPWPFFLGIKEHVVKDIDEMTGIIEQNIKHVRTTAEAI